MPQVRLIMASFVLMQSSRVREGGSQDFCNCNVHHVLTNQIALHQISPMQSDWSMDM